MSDLPFGWEYKTGYIHIDADGMHGTEAGLVVPLSYIGSLGWEIFQIDPIVDKTGYRRFFAKRPKSAF